MSEAAMTILNLGVIVVALAALLTMVGSGALREKALRLGPTRDLLLNPVAYQIGSAGVLLFVALHLALGGIDASGAQLLLALMPFLLVGLLIGVSTRCEAGLRKIGLIPRHPARDVYWGLAAAVIGLGLAGGSGMLVSWISELMNMPTNDVVHETLERLQNDRSTDFLIQVIIGAVIIAPLFEELVFRGVLQTCLVRLRGGARWWPIVITAALFSVTHYWAVDWQGLVPLFVLGLLFGYVYERTGSLLVPILAHAGFNAANIAMLMAMPPS